MTNWKAIALEVTYIAGLIKSDTKLLTHEVLQESILGPVLFIRHYYISEYIFLYLAYIDSTIHVLCLCLE